MDIKIDKNSRVPIYDQIKEQIKGLIHAGQIKTGDQLPTIRELSVNLSVNFNTVALAYRDLVNEGVIITERGKGTFAASTPGVEAMQTIRREKLQNLTEVRVSSVGGVLFAVSFVLAIIGVAIMDMNGVSESISVTFLVIMILIGIYILVAVQIASQWEKAVVLRFGKFHNLKGPGLFWIVPIVDSVVNWIDHRVNVTPFSAEKTLTKDTVPVDVDAVLFWLVWDAQKAALEVADYKVAISWAAQTALREIIGQMSLADILVGRSKMDDDLQKIIDERTTPWGVSVQSVEIRDVIIPPALEDAMSRQAQAERERQARVILGESEKQIASSFAEAAKAYRDNPQARH